MATANLLNTLWPGSGGTASQSSTPAYNPQGVVNTLWPGAQQNVPINASAQKVITSGNSGGSSGGSGGGAQNPQNILQSQYGVSSFSPNNALDILHSIENQKSGIASGWDSYINSLNDYANNGLNDQRTAQEGIVNSQLTESQNTINAQKTKSLRDISGNIKNAFQAGNTYLGSAGAGDSSAANQYSFALQKEAAKQTSGLNEFVNTQLQSLQSQHDQQIQGITSWFADAQNQIKQQIATGQLNKQKDLQAISSQLLDYGKSLLSNATQQYNTQYNALLGWAASNSKNVGQLQQNIAAIPQAIGTPSVDSGGNFRAPTGYGGSNDQTKNTLFQNPSWLQ